MTPARAGSPACSPWDRFAQWVHPVPAGTPGRRPIAWMICWVHLVRAGSPSTGRLGPGWDGVYPRPRGGRWGNGLICRSTCGFTPARAGLPTTRHLGPIGRRDDPRFARGCLCCRALPPVLLRSIPVCTGLLEQEAFPGFIGSEYPGPRGVRIGVQIQFSWRLGPPVRAGSASCSGSRWSSISVHPGRAGFASSWCGSHNVDGVHPRPRGDSAREFLVDRIYKGPPPSVRGLPFLGNPSHSAGLGCGHQSG